MKQIGYRNSVETQLCRAATEKLNETAERESKKKANRFRGVVVVYILLTIRF